MKTCLIFDCSTTNHISYEKKSSEEVFLGMSLCPKCSANPTTATPIWKWKFENKERSIRGCIGLFLKNFFSNFLSHIKDSKWDRKCISINYTSYNGSPQQIPFQFANEKLPDSRCRAFWV